MYNLKFQKLSYNSSATHRNRIWRIDKLDTDQVPPFVLITSTFGLGPRAKEIGCGLRQNLVGDISMYGATQRAMLFVFYKFCDLSATPQACPYLTESKWRPIFGMRAVLLPLPTIKDKSFIVSL